MNTQTRRDPFMGFLRFIWRGIRMVNHLVWFALIAFVALMFFIGTISGSGAGPKLLEKSALVIDLDGTLVEENVGSPLDQLQGGLSGNAPKQLRLRDLMKVLEEAKKDSNIDRIVLLTDGFNARGFASMRDFAVAIDDFKKSGKDVIAYGVNMEQKQYFIATRANKIYMDPEGGMLLEGLGRYRMYYREALEDKLGVDVHLFRVGEFKSAAEPYILDAASPESREADLFWMNDIWQRFVADIAAARKLKVEDINTMVNDLPAEVKAAKGDLAKWALDRKLVDGLMTEHELEEMLSKQGVFDEENKTFRQIGYRQYLMMKSMPNPFQFSDDQAKVAVVVAQGEITDGVQPPGTVGGRSTSDLIRQAREDENTKALVLRVDSPGGGVYPSEQIRREIALTKEAGIPVVVSMGNVAASGGYWISMNADKIIADPSTITGSIGIFGMWLSSNRTLEKIGVRTDGVGTTPLAGAFDPTREFDPRVGEVVQTIIDRGYAQFIGKVAEARKSSADKIDLVARGRVWSGAQAKERGLVDQLGGLQDAINEAAALAKLKKDDYKLAYVERPPSPLEALVQSLEGNARTEAMASVLAAYAPIGKDAQAQLINDLQWIDRNGKKPYQAVVHCLCDL
jgi:protease IV